MKKLIERITPIGDTIIAEYISNENFNQESAISEQHKYYSQFNFTTQEQWDSLYATKNPNAVSAKKIKSQGGCNLNKIVFGWNPYWISSSQYNNYDYSLLSDLSFFSYEVNANTGAANTTNGWMTNGAVTNAQNAGCRVNLCATLFANHATFLNSTSAKNNFISTIISLVQQRNGNGVNIDFEGMAASNRNAFAGFMVQLGNQLHAAIPGSQLSIALPSVDWGNVMDVQTMGSAVDLFLIMGYDYYWRGSSNAGPVSPLNHGNFWNGIDCSRSIVYYLDAGVPANKLALGVPYYGYDWPTTSNALNSTTTGQGTSVVYYNAIPNSQNYGRIWDVASSTPHYTYNSSGWRQCFYDDEQSLTSKYERVNFLNLAGIGIWALGYDDGYVACWDAIKNNFTNCAAPQPCSDTITDIGGPGDYYDDENWTYTIAPQGAQQVTLSFSSFDLETNYDFLYVYDGPTITSPLIGTYTGNTNPGTLTATSGQMTLRFTSDGNTTNQGWTAVWNCISDNISPTTAINTLGTWQTANFNAYFNDQDNQNGSGVEKAFYQVIDYDGADWRANNTQGFFYDNFDLITINSEWTSVTGTWAISNQVLEQSDQNLSNTNIYASLTQNLSNKYLYKWNGKIDGTSNNRRAGFHFFSDNGNLTNRGNSYFVWFRLDQGTCEFYKVVNDIFTLQQSVPMTIVANQWYEYKVIYDRITGEIQVYQDNTYIGAWADTSPYNNGQYISFRSGNCNWQVNDLRIYRSRATNAVSTISVGNCASCMIRYQNQNPISPSGKLCSIVRDSANNFSTVYTHDVNIDWTPPDSVLVFDGTITDIDTIYNNNTQYDLFYTVSQDSNSGLAQYYYAIGTSPNAADVVNWTTNQLNLNTQITSLNLNYNQVYYASVKSENAAGLISNSTSSDGCIILNNSAINENNFDYGLNLFPNPSNGNSTLHLFLKSKTNLSIILTDALGRKIATLADTNDAMGEYTLNINTKQLNLKEGVYFITISTNKTQSIKLIITY